MIALRLAALMGVGTLGVHQLRFLFGYRADAAAVAADQGHGYMPALAPVLAGVLMLALAQAIGRIARGAFGHTPRFRRLWAGASAGLLATYSAQELIEGALAPHHPVGLAGVAGHGGWVALPLALLFGLAIAALMRGAGAAELGDARRPWRAPEPLAPRSVVQRVAPATVRTRFALPAPARAPPLPAA